MHLHILAHSLPQSWNRGTRAYLGPTSTSHKSTNPPVHYTTRPSRKPSQPSRLGGPSLPYSPTPSSTAPPSVLPALTTSAVPFSTTSLATTSRVTPTEVTGPQGVTPALGRRPPCVGLEPAHRAESGAMRGAEGWPRIFDGGKTCIVPISPTLWAIRAAE